MIFHQKIVKTEYRIKESINRPYCEICQDDGLELGERKFCCAMIPRKYDYVLY